MSSPTDKLDIVVGEFPTDAALYNINGVRTLFLSSGQTFSSAVRNVRNVLPGIALEAAERMIREQCPEFKDIDDLLGLTKPAPPSVDRPPAPPVDDVVKEQHPNKRCRKVVLVAALLPALAASWALGRYTNVASTTPTGPAQTTAAVPEAAAESPADPRQAPFLEPRFTHFAGASNIDCDPISPLEAECTDADGKVMSTKAATGPDSTIFTFSYGSERIGLRIFYEASYAATWARQDGTQDLYPNLQMHGRYALWGTDKGRLKEYGALLAHGDHGVTAMGGTDPLPPRLAALTLGTLGLNQDQVHQLVAQTPVPVPADTSTIVAARLVLGLEHGPLSPIVSVPASDDIVAIAAGIEPAPSADGPSTEPTSPPPTTHPAAQPAQPTTEPVTKPTPPAETKPPATTPSEPAKPSTETAPPAQTAPPPEPATPPKTSPATTPPAEEEPSTPPAETPTPMDPAPPGEPMDPAPPAAPPTGEPAEPPAGQAPDPTPAAPPPAENPPAEVPPAEVPPVEVPARPHDEAGDDLLILDSAWTVAVA